MPLVPNKRNWRKTIARQKYLILMVITFVVWVIIFRYVPLWGWLMAFQDYKPWKSIADQQWVGLKQFIELFKDVDFYRSMRNTLAMSFLGLAFGFPIPIMLALLINEIKHPRFKRTVQTISYLPHFVSWVVIASIVFRVLSPLGIVNEVLIRLGIIDNAIAFMGEPAYFWWIVVFTDLWKEMGWNSIVYLAAMAGVSPELHEAAIIDGAGRFKRMWYVTIPGIMPTIVVLLVLSIGNIINIGFERQFLLRTASTRDVADVIDLYILNYGIGTGRFSFGTAAGVFKSVVSLSLLSIANWLSRRTTGYKVI
ncbi:MAG: sugar ABC transporter permease [Firmicutes bacterium]|nr:sugar ABC transporter permease [Bacillota bacterium]